MSEFRRIPKISEKQRKFQRTRKLNEFSANFQRWHCFDTLEISTLLAICRSKICTNFQAEFQHFGQSVSNFQKAIRFFDSMVFNFRRVVLFKLLFKQCFISFSTTIDGCVTAQVWAPYQQMSACSLFYPEFMQEDSTTHQQYKEKFTQKGNRKFTG